MNKTFIHKFLSGKIIIDNNTSSEINKLIELFPYCETIRKIDILIKYREESITYKESLPKTSIYSSNRKKLFLILLKDSDKKIYDKIYKIAEPNLGNSKHQFHDWLKIEATENQPKKIKKLEKELISVDHKTSDDLMTETLAKLYLEQGHFDQSIRAYQILCLKYPKKSSLFASEIKKINKIKLNK
tara:strand:- start:69 stop:626 length:558 start_codon:yes stop_codon:yes gene_type:complete